MRRSYSHILTIVAAINSLQLAPLFTTVSARRVINRWASDLTWSNDSISWRTRERGNREIANGKIYSIFSASGSRALHLSLSLRFTSVPLDFIVYFEAQSLERDAVKISLQSAQPPRSYVLRRFEAVRLLQRFRCSLAELKNLVEESGFVRNFVIHGDGRGGAMVMLHARECSSWNLIAIIFPPY